MRSSIRLTPVARTSSASIGPTARRRLGREQSAAAAHLEHAPARPEFRRERHRFGDEGLGEPHDAVARRDVRLRGDVADPVVRQVGARQDQMARLERPDGVADEASAGRLDDVMNLLFGMEVPAHRAERVAVLPRLEGLAPSDLDDLEVRLHPVPTRRRLGSEAHCIALLHVPGVPDLRVSPDPTPRLAEAATTVRLCRRYFFVLPARARRRRF